MKRPAISAARLAAVVLLLAPAGCNSQKSGLTVSGRLVEDGQPIKVSTEGLPPGSRPIQLIFYALPKEGDAAGESFYSEINSDSGEFTVKGPTGKGIPPGKYRISVAALSPASGKPSAGGIPPGMGNRGPNSAGMMGMSDRFKGAFSRERSKLEVEITRSSQVVVEVGKKPGVSVQ